MSDKRDEVSDFKYMIDYLDKMQKSLEEKIEKVSDHVYKIKDECNNIKIHQKDMENSLTTEHDRMNSLLEEHMRRTRANEELIEIENKRLERLEDDLMVSKEVKKRLEAYQKDLDAKRSAKIKRISIWAGILSAVASGIYYIILTIS